jgi:hypothetical protein
VPLYRVTYTAIVEAVNEEDACDRMMQSEDTEVDAEEIVPDSGGMTVAEWEMSGKEWPVAES